MAVAGLMTSTIKHPTIKIVQMYLCKYKLTAYVSFLPHQRQADHCESKVSANIKNIDIKANGQKRQIDILMEVWIKDDNQLPH